MSDAPRGDDPDEPTIHRPRLFASGERPAENEPELAPEATAGPAGAEPAGAEPAGAEPALVVGNAEPVDEQQARRRRRLTVIGVSAGVAVVIVALCAGGLGVVSAVHGARGQAADAREARRLRDVDCLELETRLNHLTPPGATTSPAARATAVQDENTAVRIYVARLDRPGDADAWRQLLDARTSFAEALHQQAKTRTPAFSVAPRSSAGLALADELAQLSAAPCAGPIRRLAAPDL